MTKQLQSSIHLRPLSPSQLWVRNNRGKILLVLGILIIAWFSLGFYLRHEVKVSRAKVEQNRIEESRRQEFMRRGAQYQQDLQQRTQTPRVRNVFDGR